MPEHLRTLLASIAEPFLALGQPDRRVYLPFLLSAAAVASIAWLARERRGATLRGWMAFLLPRRVWLHRSALLDYKLLFARAVVQAALLPAFSLSALAVGMQIAAWLRLGPWQPDRPALTPATVVALYSITVFVADDLSRYLVHRLMHRIGFLWEIHKLHHSAEVLTPFTVSRVHPLESLLYRLRGSIATGLVVGVFMWLLPGRLRAWQVLGVDLLGFAWTALGANLRHSQVWISYGPALERVLISPAQHQIHHSRDPERQDRNFGAALALWDWMFRTLYVTHGRERIRFGLDPGSRNHGDGVASALIEPLWAAARRLGTGLRFGAARPRGIVAGLCLVLTISATPAAAEPPDAGAPETVTNTDGPGQAPRSAPDARAMEAVEIPPPTASPSSPPPEIPLRMSELTVVGTREQQTAGSAHILKSRELERLDHDDSHQVLKQVPGVYSRGEDGVGLRPNIGIRGVNPDRSQKVTLTEDGVLFGPAPYSAPAAYYFPLVTRMESVRVIKGSGAISFGPQTVGGAIDLVTRAIPNRLEGGVDLAGGQYRYGKVHAHLGASQRRLGFLIEGVHLRSAGFKAMDGGGDTGFARNEIMGKLRLVPWPGGRVYNAFELKLGYSDEDSRETYLGLSDEDYRATPLRRYAASRLDHMAWRRTQAALRHVVDFGAGCSIETVVYRHDLARSWTKLNRFAGAEIGPVLRAPEIGRNRLFHQILRGEVDASSPDETLLIGPNRRDFISQGLQSVGGVRWGGTAIGHRFEFGARYHHDRIDRLHTEDGYVFRGGALEPDGAPTRTTADNRESAGALALHALHAVTWRRLTLTPGLREEFISTYALDRRAHQAREGALQRILIPGFGAYYAVNDVLGVLGGAYRGFSPAAPGQPPEVEPETSWNLEAGLRAAGSRGRAEAIGFFNDYQNLTTQCTVSSSCRPEDLGRQFNAGRAHIYGLEVFAESDLRPGGGFAVPLMLAYTYTRTRLLEAFASGDPQLGNVEPGFEMPYVPRHQGALTLAIETARAGLQAAATYTSAMREAAGQGPPGTSTDAAWVFEVGARFFVLPRAYLYFHARNLFDAHPIAARRPYGARPVSPRWVQIGAKAVF